MSKLIDIDTADELLHELEIANKIIMNALNVMSPTQTRKWDEKNERMGLKDDLGTTRNTTREEVIKKARGE